MQLHNINNRETFIKIVSNQTYEKIYNIKFKLIHKIVKNITILPKYNDNDLTDSVDIITVSLCNNLLNFIIAIKSEL